MHHFGCINHFYSCFVKTNFTLSSFYWVFLNLLLELPHLLYLRELGSTPWVCTIPLQNLESIRFFTLKAFDNLGVCNCRNPSFGLATKAKGLQGCGPRESPGVTSHIPGSVGKCEGVNPHTPKATPTLGDGVPVDSWNFREWFQGSKLNFLWRSLYHWKALRT